MSKLPPGVVEVAHYPRMTREDLNPDNGPRLSSQHYHKDEYGVWHRCYHTCRAWRPSWRFWLSMTLGFPLEHTLWERVWPFWLLTHWLGL